MAGWKSIAVATERGPAAPSRHRWINLPRLAGLSLALVLASSLGSAFESSQLRAALPVIRLWPNPPAQARLHLGQVPFDLLQAADNSLPADAIVLLVTSGQDVRHLGYTTYHRALYYLAPRAVWWVNPAPGDGTWEARWWTPMVLSTESIQSHAATRKASHVLFFGLEPPASIGRRTSRLPGGSLVALGQAPVAPDTSTHANALAPLWPLRLALAIGVPLLLGHGMLAAFGRGWVLNRMEALSLAWLMGALLVSVGMYWLNALGASLAWQVVVLTAAALALAGMTRRQATGRRAASTERVSTEALHRAWDRPPRQRLDLAVSGVLLLIIGLQLSRVAILGMGRPLTEWDSWSNWGMKGRTIYREGALTPAVYADASRLSTHPYYPPNLPLLEAWLFAWLQSPDDRLVGVIAVAYDLALAGVVYGAVRRRGGSMPLGLLATATALSVPHAARLAAAVTADLPFAVYVVTAAIYLIEYLDGAAPNSLLISALAAGALLWTKREGIVLLAALLAAVLVSHRHGSRSRRAVLASVLSASLLAGPWWILVLVSTAVLPDFLPISLDSLQANAGRLPAIGRQIAHILLDPAWAHLWPTFVGLVLVTVWCRPSPPPNEEAAKGAAGLLLPMTVVGYLALIAVSYVLSDYAPFEQHVLASFYRLSAQVVPLAAFWMATKAIRSAAIGRPSYHTTR